MRYNQKCIIYRNVTGTGYLNRPDTATIQKGPYPCCTSLPWPWKKRGSYRQETPQAEISMELVLYGPGEMDIKAGDIVCIPVTVVETTKEVILTGAEKYIASMPYKVRGHLECGISLKRSV